MDIKLKLLFFESCKLQFVLTGAMALSIILVSNVVFAIESVKIEKAKYKSEDDEFKVVVKIEEDGEDTNHTVSLFDDNTGEFLTEKTDDDETIKFKFSDISGTDVPCRVRAEVEGLIVAKDVEDAPGNCGGSGGGGNGLELQISEASYDDDDEKLKVKGKDAPSKAMVEIFDSVTGVVMDTVEAEDDGDFKSEIEDITGGEVPCMLQARANGVLSDTTDVEGDPGDCGGGGGGGGSENLISLHDRNSPLYDKNCTTSNCHVRILTEHSLDPAILTAHTAMLNETPGEKDNEKCGWCHRSVDLLDGSAGNLRRQVDANLCAVCHGPSQQAKQFYQSSPVDGEILYELTCAFCHKELADSEVKGESASEIQEKISEDEGGMGPLGTLTYSQIQAIADALSQ